MATQVNKMISLIKKLKQLQLSLIINVFVIFIFTYIALRSATLNYGNSYLIREAIAGVVGIVAFLIVTIFDYRKLKKYVNLLYGLNLFLLLLVILIGDTRLGAKRWLDLGFISIQPAELSKIIMIVCIANFVSQNYKGYKIGLIDTIKSFLYILPCFIMIAVQPDLSTSLVIFLIYAVILFVANIDIKIVFTSILGALAFIPFSFFFLLKDYQKKRILTFLHPENDLLGSGWNVMQSKIAIGSGGLYGKGFLNNTQSKLRFLPESHTDFIASVLLEEMGLFVGMLFIVVYFSLIVNIVVTAMKTRDLFGKYICYGVATIFLFHALVNLGMIMGIMPVTGLPLLFMSYGGTSLVLSFILLGLVQSVKIHRDRK